MKQIFQETGLRIIDKFICIFLLNSKRIFLKVNENLFAFDLLH